MAVIERNGTAKEFLSKYSPTMNETYCRKYLDRCFVGTAPTIYWVGEAYGDKTVESWIKGQIAYYIISQTSKAEQMMNREQFDELVENIRGKYSYLKVTEFIVFLREMKSGTLGELYGTLTPYKVGCFMQKFLRYRSMKIDEITKRMATQKAIEYSQRIREGKTMNLLQWEQFKRDHPEKVELLAKLGDVKP